MEERGNNISHVNHHGNHDNGGKKSPKFLLITIIAVVIIIGGTLAYFIINSKKGTDIECDLSTPHNNIIIRQGIGTGILIDGFKGSLDDISWVSENPNVARVQPMNPETGSHAMIIKVNPGTTTITVTDNAVGPGCTDSIIVNVL